ncbi:hypothetical protein QBC38DRAFT_486577 [Podospora fimiseda]|uniref:Mitochondrial intermembrane space import and assembly protein 40 n=1 Tax=Podospora fimiseda TaxID=252190 RepID=A0AAN7GW66_9PEZI|nr:hypothetical protein QBC38DRAFT_486577 [Podospora fimiseda]
MYRSSFRSTPSALRAISRPTTVLTTGARRFASTNSSGKKKGTWKGTATRWALAIGAVYFYNTSSIFADEFEVRTTPSSFADSDLPTIEALVEKKRRESVKPAPAPPQPPAQTTKAVEAEIEKIVDEEAKTEEKKNASKQENEVVPAAAPEPGSPEALEQEATQQGAFNPETGEINWDCPCLGGMAHGPCGEEFKAAFSCFVYSKEEPKGIECIEKFQGMQTCFRKYPEIYGSELADDEDDETPAAETADPALVKAIEDKSKEQRTEEAIPKEAVDGTAANKETKEEKQ